MLKPVIEKDTKKIRQQIAALKWQLEQDIPEKDREILEQTVRELEDTFFQMERDSQEKKKNSSRFECLRRLRGC